MHLLYHLIHLHVFFSRNFDAVMTFWRFFSCFWNGRSCGWLNVTSHFYVLAEPCRSFLGDGHAQQIFSGIFWCPPPFFFSFCGQSCCVICKNWAKTCKRRQNHASVCKNSQNMGKGSKGCPFVPILVKTISCMACTVVHGWFFKENDILASCDSCVPYNMDMKPKKKCKQGGSKLLQEVDTPLTFSHFSTLPNGPLSTVDDIGPPSVDMYWQCSFIFGLPVGVIITLIPSWRCSVLCFLRLQFLVFTNQHSLVYSWAPIFVLFSCTVGILFICSLFSFIWRRYWCDFEPLFGKFFERFFFGGGCHVRMLIMMSFLVYCRFPAFKVCTDPWLSVWRVFLF